MDYLSLIVTVKHGFEWRLVNLQTSVNQINLANHPDSIGVILTVTFSPDRK
jgi:hypothetical protein